MPVPLVHRPSPVTRSRAALVLAALTALVTVAAHAQSGIRLGEPGGEPAAAPTLDLGAPRPADPAPAPAAPSTPAAPPAPAAPSAAPGTPPGGVPLERTTYGAWEVACVDVGQCAMAQIGEDAEGVPILEMVIRKLPEPLEVGDRTAIAILDVVTPLGVVLTDGLGLTIDSGQTQAAPFQICTEQGCLVREPIDADLIERMKRGAVATLEVTAANQGPIASELSLSGFTAAYEAVE